MIESGTPAYWRATLALSLGSILIFANLYTPQPLLPLLRVGFGVTELQASLCVTISTLTLGLSLLIYGPLSDAIGRRPLMLVTMALATLCTLTIPLATDFSTLLALRALQGLFLGGLPAVALAYMGDEFKHDAMLLAVGIYIGANSVGGIAGRLMSGLAGAQWGWQGSFVAAGLVSVIILAVFVWALPPSRGFHPAPLRLGRMAMDLGRHLRNPPVLVAFLIGGINFMLFVNLYSFVTYVLSAPPYGLSTGWLGMLFLTYLSGTVAASFSGRLVRGGSQPLTMVAGIGLLILGTLMTLIPRLDAIVAGLLVNAFGFFLTHSQASGWVSRHATHARASASSLYLVFYYAGASVGGFYLGPFWNWLSWPGVVLGALVGFLAALLLAVWLRLREGVVADAAVVEPAASAG